MSFDRPYLYSAVEGPIDEAVVRRLVIEAGAYIHAAYGGKGKAYIRQRIDKFNHAARLSPWFVLVDLDTEAQCAAQLVSSWLPAPERRMCLRVAVREVEAWLLADREAISGFLAIAKANVPLAPEEAMDPKATLVALAARSRSSVVRTDMVPRPGSGRRVGPAYTSRLVEFITHHWRPEVAASIAGSLQRCRSRIAQLVAQG